MIDVTKIMDMLDWHMAPEIQSQGISLAKSIETIISLKKTVILYQNYSLFLFE